MLIYINTSILQSVLHLLLSSFIIKQTITNFNAQLVPE